MDEVVWLGTGQTCRRIGVTLRTLYRLIDDGQLPAYRFGRVIRLRADDVAGFIDGARVVPGTIGHLHSDRGVPGGDFVDFYEASANGEVDN